MHYRQLNLTMSIFFLFLISTLSLFSQQIPDKITFTPLDKNEILSYKKLNADILWNIQFFVENTLTKEQRKLCLSKYFEGIAFETINKKAIFFSASDSTEINYIWHVNGTNGTITPIIKASPTFAINSEGTYCLYYESWDEMTANAHKTPTIYLYCINKNKILQEYDFSQVSTILLNVMKITYDLIEKYFVVEIGYDKTIVERKIFMLPEDNQ